MYYWLAYRPTDTANYRGALAHLKMTKKKNKSKVEGLKKKDEQEEWKSESDDSMKISEHIVYLSGHWNFYISHH